MHAAGLAEKGFDSITTSAILKFMKTAVSFHTILFIILLGFFGLSASGPQRKGTQRDFGYKKNYNFTTNWFTQHIRVWNDVLAPFSGKADIHYLEVGVFEGRAMIWMLENILTHPTSRATAVDIFPDGLQQLFTRNIRRSGCADRVKVIKGGSQTVLKKLPPGSFDIIYIDGDHSAPAVLTDAVLSWSLLKDGGILIFDDYHYKLEERSPGRRPKISIDAFAASFAEYIDTLHVGPQFMIRKKEKIYWEGD